MGAIRRGVWLGAVACLLVPANGRGAVTPFGQNVEEAIELGLDWLRPQQAADGSWNADSTGIVTLSFLEKRVSAEADAPIRGYAGMDADDQERVRRAVAWVIGAYAPFRQVGGPAAPYPVGSSLAPLAVYAATGGPPDVGAAVPVPVAVANAVANLKARQGGPPAECPRCPGAFSLDYSGTCATGCIFPPHQFPMAGLSAAAAVVDDAANTLDRAVPFIDQTRNADGGHRYHSTNTTGYGVWPSSTSLSATAVWSYSLAGLPPEDERIQGVMRWLAANYTYTWNIQCSTGVVVDGEGRRYGPFPCEIQPWYRGYHYSLWALVKAMGLMDHPPQDGALFATDIGHCPAPADRECHRDTVADGFPEEAPSVYYDVAFTLLGMQTGDGQFPVGAPPRMGHEPFSDQAFALLALERSLGGVVR